MIHPTHICYFLQGGSHNRDFIPSINLGSDPKHVGCLGVIPSADCARARGPRACLTSTGGIMEQICNDLEETGMFSVEEYIAHRQNSIADFIAT
jgi:hypothetical protein